MSENKNIRAFTAADIEKYWKGQLSKAEMHAIENAAMDDPFLADALDGYKNTGTASSDIQQLNKKIEVRISEETKVLHISTDRIKWLRVAAAIIIIGGIGVLTQQLFFKSGKNELALSKDEKITNPDSVETSPPVTTDTAASLSVTKESKDEKNKIKETKIVPESQSASADNKPVNETIVSKENISFEKDINKKSEDEADKAAAKPAAAAESVVITSSKTKADSIDRSEAFALKEVAVPEKKQSVSLAARSAGIMTNVNHRFTYRIVDAQKNPVPFANVTNTHDGVGTYTDMNGYFNLVSSDSMMNVQVRSLGYTTSTFKLLSSGAASELVVREDDKLRESILANSRKVVSSVTRKDTAELEEPEVGWSYYNTYAANNLNISQNISDKKPVNNVELSFDVDKNGQPVNIKVTKSSECKACDEEAIRLLRDGPKWKRKGKKAKTAVIVNVDK